jgi:hypothetical protein
VVTGAGRAVVAARLPRHEWPARPMIVVAIDTHAGELAAFDRDSGVDLVDAVTAGTALRGSSPTISINATHYINGGVRSPENADLASGYANVVVLSLSGGRSGPLPDGQFEGLRRQPEWGTDLASTSKVEALRKQGSRVEVITPDADSQAAMGTNQMDPATRIPSARAGFVQGKLHKAGNENVETLAPLSTCYRASAESPSYAQRRQRSGESHYEAARTHASMKRRTAGRWSPVRHTTANSLGDRPPTGRKTTPSRL